MSSRCFAYPMVAAAVLLAPESVRAGDNDLPALATAPFDAEKARRHQDAWSEYLGQPVEIANSIGMKFVLIPAGDFMMGASDSERQWAKAQVDTLGWREEVALASKESIHNEGPRHGVRITQPFYLGVYPVTQEAYEEVIGANPSWFSREGRGRDQVLDQDTSRFPVERVRWKDAIEFCRRLSAIEAERSAGREYRLPTEAEWEYACRAGTTSRYSFGDDPAELDRYGWYSGNSDKQTHRVGLKKPNAWGLYDMHGNVWELCADWYQSDYYANSPTNDPQGPASGTFRVARGGSWLLPALGNRTAIRLRDKPGQVGLDMGFRVALVLAEGESRGPEPPVEGPKPEEQPSAGDPPVGLATPWNLPPGAPPPAIAPFDVQQAQVYQESWSHHLGQLRAVENSIGMKLVLIPPGESTMGAPESEKGHQDWEGPRHRVRMTNPFYLSAHEVTVGVYLRFVAATDYVTDAEDDGIGGWGWSEGEKGLVPDPKYHWRNVGFPQEDDHPVVNVSWNDAVAFCKWLSGKEGREYRLPTEAEWEYACRAGTTTPWYHGDEPEELTAVGNVADATAKARLPDWAFALEKEDGYVFTAPVGRFKPNGFGLFDMHGNVGEWCADWYDAEYYRNSPRDNPPGPASGTARVYRGGSWGSYWWNCRSAYRRGNRPAYRDASLGFRVALVAEESDK